LIKKIMSTKGTKKYKSPIHLFLPLPSRERAGERVEVLS